MLNHRATKTRRHLSVALAYSQMQSLPSLLVLRRVQYCIDRVRMPFALTRHVPVLIFRLSFCYQPLRARHPHISYDVLR